MHLSFRLALCIPLLVFGQNVLAAEKSQSIAQDLLIASKFSGGCGIIIQMATFQQSTKMPGGDEFLERFLKTESARVGMTVKNYLEQCRTSSEIYQTYYNGFEDASAH